MQIIIGKVSNGNMNKGDIIEVVADGSEFNDVMRGAFVMVSVPGVLMSGFEDRHERWRLNADYAIVAQNTTIDGFRLKLFATNVSSTRGFITREIAEQWIVSWNGIVHSVAENEVVFDITIYGALCSEPFWETDISAFNFSELSYEPDTGVHTIRAEYQDVTRERPTYIEQRIAKKGLEIISHTDKIIVFEGTRVQARDEFQRDIQDKTRVTIARSRYHVSESVVDNIIAQGGVIETDTTTAMSYIQDKLNE